MSADKKDNNAFPKRLQTYSGIYEDTNLTGYEKLVLGYLVSATNRHTGKCFPSNRTIARACSLNPKTARKAYLSLEAKGYLTIVPTKASSNLYKVSLSAIDCNSTPSLIREAPLPNQGDKQRKGTKELDCIDTVPGNPAHASLPEQNPVTEARDMPESFGEMTKEKAKDMASLYWRDVWDTWLKGCKDRWKPDVFSPLAPVPNSEGETLSIEEYQKVCRGQIFNFTRAMVRKGWPPVEAMEVAMSFDKWGQIEKSGYTHWPRANRLGTTGLWHRVAMELTNRKWARLGELEARKAA